MSVHSTRTRTCTYVNILYITEFIYIYTHVYKQSLGGLARFQLRRLPAPARKTSNIPVEFRPRPKTSGRRVPRDLAHGPTSPNVEVGGVTGKTCMCLSGAPGRTLSEVPKPPLFLGAPGGAWLCGWRRASSARPSSITSRYLGPHLVPFGNLDGSQNRAAFNP